MKLYLYSEVRQSQEDILSGYKNHIRKEPEKTLLKQKRILMMPEGNITPESWSDIKEYIIDSKFRNTFSNNKKINLQFKADAYFPNITFYSYLNIWNMFLFKRMFGIHWSQKPENIKWIIGLILSYGGGIISSPFWRHVYHHFIQLSQWK